MVAVRGTFGLGRPGRLFSLTAQLPVRSCSQNFW